MNKSNLSVLLALVGLGLLKSKAGAKNTDNISMDLTIDISSVNSEYELADLKLLLKGLSRMDRHIGDYSLHPANDLDLDIEEQEEHAEVGFILYSLFSVPDEDSYGHIYDELKWEIDSLQDLYELARRFSWANIENIEETGGLLKYKIVVDVDAIFKIWEIDFRKRAIRKISSNFEEYLRFEIVSVLRYAFDLAISTGPLPYRIDNINIPSYFNTTTIFGSHSDLRPF